MILRKLPTFLLLYFLVFIPNYATAACTFVELPDRNELICEEEPQPAPDAKASPKQSLEPKSFINEPDGFRGLKWGTNRKDISGLVFKSRKDDFGGIEIYKRAGDDLTIGDAKLETILYIFWKSELCSVYLLTSGTTNYSIIFDSLKIRFGEPTRSNQVKDSYYWIGDITNISLEHKSDNKEVTTIFRSKRIMDEQLAYRKARAAEGANKGF